MRAWLGKILLLLAAGTLAVVMGGALMEWFWNPVPPRVDSRTLNGMVIPGWPDFYTFLPGSRTVAVSPTAEFVTRYEINRLGFRDREIPLRKNPGVWRIVFVGDSFTEGYGVEQDQVYSHAVQNLSTGCWECINAGMRAMSPAFAYFRARRLLEAGLEFDALVCQVYDNDCDDDQNHTQKFAIRRDADTGRLTRGAFHDSTARFAILDWMAKRAVRYQIGRIGMALVQGGKEQISFRKKLPPHLAEQVREVYRTRGIALAAYTDSSNDVEITFPMQSDFVLETEQIDELWVSMREWMLDGGGFQPPAVSQAQLELTLGYLGSLRALLRDAGKEFLVLYQPSASLRLVVPIEGPLADYCRQLNIPFLSLRQPLLEACSNSPAAFFYPIDGHLTAAGQKAVGEIVFPWLEKELHEER